MPLILQENFTVRLIELLRQGELDAAIMALPFPEQGLTVQPLYDEEFVVALPKHHRWAGRAAIDADDLKNETMLLLGNGHCFRDQVLGVCPELSRFSHHAATAFTKISRVRRWKPSVTWSRAASALPCCRACRYMKSSRTRAASTPACSATCLRRARAGPSRGARVAQELHARMPAIDAICDAINACDLPGVKKLDLPVAVN